MNDGGDLEKKSASGSRPPGLPAGSTLRTFILWLLAGLFLGGIAALVIVRWKFGDSLPAITPADYLAARDKWRANAPPDYDIEVQVTGARAAKYRVEVRGGEATGAWMNGQLLPQKRIYGTWSVPGMFGTMSRDVEALDRHAKGTADKFTPRLTLRAEFDPHYGYPAAYRRIQWGKSAEVTWRVTKFEVRAAP
jgi:hypothetical protein